MMASKYGPPKTATQTSAEKKEYKRLYASHYMYCAANDYHTYDEYLEAMKPVRESTAERKAKIERMTESGFEKGRRILREKGLEKR